MIRRIIGLGLLAGLTWATPALAQEARCPEPACAAVAGGRTEGWAAQSRAEVIARNGMVTSSQPLATQAGLAILRKGGNAVDAAVATAAVLGVVEPFSTGIASDLFMIVWVAKEKKLYALNAAGTAPTGEVIRAVLMPMSLDVAPFPGVFGSESPAKEAVAV
jgi:gamma-glutamyltranspeptidase/glutathione hydrolase